MQITPKALTALQKLLSINSPTVNNDKYQNQQSGSKSLQKSVQNISGNQQEAINNKLINKISSPKAIIESTIRSSIGRNNNIKHNSDVKNELINVLKKTYNPKNKSIKKNGNTLNQLLQPLKYQTDNHHTYKKKRPPQLGEFEEDDIQEDKNKIMSAKSVQKSPSNLNRYTSGFFTSTHQKQNGMNVFGSLNEVLRQYIQTKSQMKQAGTGEGVKIIKCQSARNAENKNSDKKMFLSENKLLLDKKQNDFNHQLQELYLKTSKILQAYQTKEALWKIQKQSLRNEARFLKQLLQQQQQDSQQPFQWTTQ